MVLVDSNVIIDVLTRDPLWRDWSKTTLDQLRAQDQLAINPIIYAELASTFHHADELQAALPESEFVRLALPYPAAFLAGQCFLRYRRQGGLKRSPLPDFYIGAHATVSGLTLVTRDVSRYRTYFPEISLIAP